MDVVRFDDNEIRHFKRISTGFSFYLDYLFLDISSSIVYMFKELSRRKRLHSNQVISGTKCQYLTAFDYSGNPVLEKETAIDFGDELKIDRIFHIRKSFFLALCSSLPKRVFKIFSVTRTGTIVSKIIELSRPGMFKVAIRCLYSLRKVHYFDQVLACAIVSIPHYGIWSCNIATEEHRVLYRASNNEHIHRFNLNWDLSEIAVWISKAPDYGLFATKKYLKIIKLPHQDISLKHFARLTCLRSFGEKYLNEHLPVCLRKYLGILKE